MLAIVTGLLLSSLMQFGGIEDPGSPGDGVGLAPNPIERTTAGTSTRDGATPYDGPPGPFRASPGTIASIGIAALGVGYRKREDPLVVVVHGDGGAAENFDDLIASIGVDSERVVAFNYSVVDESESSTTSSHVVSTKDAAEALDDLLRSLSQNNANIYTIHHSRGGSIGVELIADLDDGVRPPIDGYRGAALLDPAIAAGGLGELQSVGGADSALGRLIPDDGGFDPIRCDDSGCRDIREGLGATAGVEVIAIRNPDAELTNFDDEPAGLRVFDLPDGKPRAWVYWMMNPIFGWWRMSEAHGSVLTSDVVADCVASEIESPGSCRGLDPPQTKFTFGGGGGRNLVL